MMSHITVDRHGAVAVIREIEHLAHVADTPDFAEGLTAFFEKRAARFGLGRTDENEA